MDNTIFALGLVIEAMVAWPVGFVWGALQVFDVMTPDSLNGMSFLQWVYYTFIYGVLPITVTGLVVYFVYQVIAHLIGGAINNQFEVAHTLFDQV